jgi:DNA invertase Pin-like site-specific DNA recombinase
MTIIGYARVSTTDQDLDIQVAALKREGCTTIRSEKRSGTTTANREELRTVLDFLRKGDVLVVTRIDRLARSIGDLQDIVRAVRAKGASLKATEQPIDTSTAAGKCFLDMLGVFAEFETRRSNATSRASPVTGSQTGARPHASTSLAPVGSISSHSFTSPFGGRPGRSTTRTSAATPSRF